MRTRFLSHAFAAVLFYAVLSAGPALCGADGEEVVVAGEPTQEDRAAWGLLLEFFTEKGIGTSLVVLLGLLRAGYSPDDPTVRRGTDYVLRAVQTDGGIYTPGGHIPVYESCLALSCFAYAKGRFGTDRFDAVLERGEEFVRGQQ